MLLFVVILGIIVLLGVTLYNSLVAKKNQVQNVFASIDALLKKRYDLIPNLISTVQTYMQYEKQTLTEITEIRAQAVSPQITDDQKINLDNKISRALGGLMVAVENYPQLKANQNFMQLQGALNEIEEQVSAARRAYNAAVTDYNNAVEMFPTNFVASMMHYTRKQVFEISKEQRQNVNVKNLFNKN
ncbi:MAG: LemA family protein [Candidatus Omnitrophota bacterium]|nr:MAG: LemA family protein [Candidatus Omnitrophota bacterium]